MLCLSFLTRCLFLALKLDLKGGRMERGHCAACLTKGVSDQVSSLGKRKTPTPLRTVWAHVQGSMDFRRSWVQVLTQSIRAFVSFPLVTWLSSAFVSQLGCWPLCGGISCSGPKYNQKESSFLLEVPTEALWLALGAWPGSSVHPGPTHRGQGASRSTMRASPFFSHCLQNRLLRPFSPSLLHFEKVG